jgi:hypothetical protein
MACPHGALTSAKVKDPMSYLAWKEGPHAVSARMTSTSDATPDRVRILVLGTDKDGYGVYDFPRLSCTSPGQDIPPGRNANWEWNSIARDIDLRAYPGAKAGDQFVWRSKPLANGSKLMFEVRGSILVTRQ